MKSEEFCMLINEIEDDYIIKAHEEKKTAKAVPRKKVIALVACLVLLAALATAVFAASDFGIRIIEKITEPDGIKGETQVGAAYSISADVEKIPLKEFSDEINDLKDVFTKQYEEHKIDEDIEEGYPGRWQKRFDTLENAKNYVGLERLVLPDWESESERDVVVYVSGNASGKVEKVSIRTLYYHHKGVWVTVTATAYTEYYKDEIVYGMGTSEEVDYKENIFVNENGTYCLEIRAMPVEKGKTIQGYIVKDGILYAASFDFADESFLEEAEELFCEWANMY